MFVADIKREPECLGDPVKIVDLNKTGCEYFASVINQRSLAVFDDILRILGSKQVNSDTILKASLALSHANKVVLTYTPTKSTCCQQIAVLGVLVVCQALLTLGKAVTLVVNEADKKLFGAVVNYLTNLHSVAHIKIVSMETATQVAFDCLLTITEDCGHELFKMAQKNPHTNIVALNRTEAPVKAGADYAILTESISTGACALAGGLYVVSSSPYHWRYKNYSINMNKPPQFSLTSFIPTNDQVRQ